MPHSTSLGAATLSWDAYLVQNIGFSSIFSYPYQNDQV
jgi:hypothetical protein